MKSLHVFYVGIKRKAIKRDGDLKEVVQMLSEIERESQEKYEEREDKRLKMFLDAEERRRVAYADEEKRRQEDERRHDEQMQYMFISFLQQTMMMMTGGERGYPTPGQRLPSTHFPQPIPPPTHLLVDQCQNTCPVTCTLFNHPKLPSNIYIYLTSCVSAQLF